MEGGHQGRNTNGGISGGGSLGTEFNQSGGPVENVRIRPERMAEGGSTHKGPGE